MTPEQIKDLAIECKLINGYDGDGLVAIDIRLIAYAAAIEAPLQARIEQLEEALQDLLDEGVLKSSIICKALNIESGNEQS